MHISYQNLVYTYILSLFYCCVTKISANTRSSIMSNISWVLSQITTFSTSISQLQQLQFLHYKAFRWPGEERHKGVKGRRGGAAAARYETPDMRTKRRAKRRLASLPRGAETDLRPCLRPSARCTSVPRYQPLISNIFYPFCISPNMNLPPMNTPP